MAKGAYIGVLNEYYPAFADNTWAQIIKACQKNEVPSSWAVGDSKMMTINGKDYPIDIIGKKHDTYADGSGTAPLTFQMHDIYASSYAMNSSNTNSGGWESTAIRTTRLPAILALMPSEVQAGIKEVNKITGQGGSSFALETTADKLFILSVNEIFGYEPSDVAKGEGSQYAYYANGNSTQKKQNGEYNYWWTRSPVANNSSGFFQVRTDGRRVSTNYPSGTYGVAFAFCFGGTSELNTEFPSLGSVARKVKKGYVGIDGKARKIKKAYIGIGGVARPCFGDKELVYYGTTTSLSVGRAYMGATTVGNYAIFAGGMSIDGYHKTVDTYTTSLTKGTATDLTVTLASLAATTVGNYALFGGGTSDGYGKATVVNTYTSSLTRGVANALSSGRTNLAATTVGNYALIGGGQANSGYSPKVDAYNTSLTKSSASEFTASRAYYAASTVGGYALFGGGGSPYTDVVDAYNESKTLSNPTKLSVARGMLSATTVGNYLLFAGGQNDSGTSAIVDVYNTSLTRSTTTNLSVARQKHAATTVGNYAVFGGGSFYASPYYSAVVDVYDASLTHSTSTNLSEIKYEIAATTVGNYALFGGGTSNKNPLYKSSVDVYTIV